MNEELQEILIEVVENWGYETVEAMKRKLATFQPYPTRDQGNLRASLSYKVNPDLSVSFIAPDYAKFIDEGTGLFGPEGRRFDPSYRKKLGSILDRSGWASRKNLNPWATAASIYKKGGLKPRKFYNDVIAQRVGDGSLEIAINAALQLYQDNIVL